MVKRTETRDELNWTIPHIDEATDTIWAANSPDLYVLLTAERGWSPARLPTPAPRPGATALPPT